jgi:hypothetical protein
MRFVIYFILLSFISGCASISTTGSAPDEDYQHDLKSVYIVFTDFIHKGQHNWLWKDHPKMSASADALMKKIGVLAEQTWPKKFAEHGIHAEVALLSKQIQNSFSMIFIDSPKSNPDYLLEINLKDVTPGIFGVFNVDYEVIMRDRRIITGIKLWEGSLEVHKGIFPPNEANLAKEMADKILAQMKENGVAKRNGRN